ncbi:uncharacterized protein PV09_03643 [Verruconis gallopava]|uniref:Aquaporin n=1 Tax=Verruconis gallopava TaxID=253628 RepID=A0A0D2AFP0_9PEZI|nr:uncharacterized protein PV09_03643 [Verruconis gallopava]KIW05788.1 hypothetical protein PV09_03643 [Verruconis gallopava]
MKQQYLVAYLVAFLRSAVATPIPVNGQDIVERSPQHGRYGERDLPQYGGLLRTYLDDQMLRFEIDGVDDTPIIITPIDINQEQNVQVIQSTVEKRSRKPDAMPIGITQIETVQGIENSVAKRWGRPKGEPIDITQIETAQEIQSSVEKRDSQPTNVNQIECSQVINSVVQKRELNSPKNVFKSFLEQSLRTVPPINKFMTNLKNPEDPAPIRRWRTNSAPISPTNINSQPFVGRVGGNQLHAVSESDPDYEKLQITNPDAVQSPKWRAILSLRPFGDIHLWRNACLEGVGLCCWVFMAGLVSHGTADLSTATTLGAVIPVGIAALVQFLIVTLFIFSLGPVTGAHLTPLITFATFLAKLTSLPRMILYITFQCIGALIGAYILRSALGGDPSTLIYSPGCYVDPNLVSAEQVFALETMGSLFVLYLAFGLGLDPRNKSNFSPATGPFLVGLSSAVALFAGGISMRGYYGLSCNPARCLGLMSAAHRFNYHWVHWLGDFVACIVHAFLYYAVPPFCNQRIQD